MTLNELEIGASATVKSINCPNNALKKHFIDIGFTPGVKVTLIKTAPLGNPIEIMIRGYELTLGIEEATQIEISKLTKENSHYQADHQLVHIEHPKIGETLPNKDTSLLKITEHIKFALVGNPNAGKTSLFNKLTGDNLRVGNFPGVTVEKKQGELKHHPDITLIDLPGIYSLSTYSKEELITRNFILNEKPHCIINIVDASNIERNLYLTLQLMELNTPMVLALNMMDEVLKTGTCIDINSLERTLGIPVVPISALKKEGFEELIEHAENIARTQKKPDLDLYNPKNNQQKPLHDCIQAITHLIKETAKSKQIPCKFAAIKMIERDTMIQTTLHLDNSKQDICNKIIDDLTKSYQLDGETIIADMRFSFIEYLCSRLIIKNKEPFSKILSLKIDKILTGKYTAFPVFLTVIGLIFYLTFESFGSMLSHLLNSKIEQLINFISTLLTNYHFNPAVHSLIIEGALTGIGSILSFLPTIIVLFFFLSLLEDSGYMARISFIMDKLLRKVGLSGCSFAPMLIGFGCSVPAIMATRILPSERDRKLTILLIPFMSCSAKLPIYAMFTAAFFKESQTLIMISLYLIGIIIGFLFINILKFFAFNGAPVPFVMELPNYRIPDAKSIFRLIFYRVQNFVQLAFTIIFTVSIIVWFLQHFDIRLNFVTDSSISLLSYIGNIITPVFKPLGIADWRISTAFISGFLAKESVISSLTIMLGDASKLSTIFTKLTAFVFLIFSLLYTPCIAAIATVKGELGKRWAIGIILIQCTIAWCVAFICYKLGLFCGFR